LGLGSMEVVKSAPAMGVDHGERSIFLAKMKKHAHKRRVLQHIGKISGMVAVTIVHGRGARTFYSLARSR